MRVLKWRGRWKVCGSGAGVAGGAVVMVGVRKAVESVVDDIVAVVVVECR